jgi:hypothetical protein
MSGHFFDRKCHLRAARVQAFFWLELTLRLLGSKKFDVRFFIMLLPSVTVALQKAITPLLS